VRVDYTHIPRYLQTWLFHVSIAGVTFNSCQTFLGYHTTAHYDVIRVLVDRVGWHIGDPFRGYMLLGPSSPSRKPRDCNDFPKLFKQSKATHTHWNHNDCPILVKLNKVTHTPPLPKKKKKATKTSAKTMATWIVAVTSHLSGLFFCCTARFETRARCGFLPFFQGRKHEAQ